MIRFPKWKYHAVLEARIVDTEADEKALGQGWFDSPADIHALKEALSKIEPEPADSAPKRRGRKPASQAVSE